MIWRALGADPLTRGWAIVTGAGVARLGLGLVASFVIARALGPAAYGVYAVLAATVGIVGALAEGGLTEAAVLRMSAARSPTNPAPLATTVTSIAHARESPQVALPAEARPPTAPVAEVASSWLTSAAERAAAFFWLRIALATAVIAVGCLIAGPVADELLHVDQNLLRWALIGIVATALSGATSAILQARGAFGRMSWLTLANTGLTVVLAIALALTNQLTLLTALVVLGVGTSLATFAISLLLLPHNQTLRTPKLHQLKGEAKKLVQIGRWLWLASIFAMLAVNLDVLVLNRWAALSVVGAYALAVNLATKADLVNQSLYTVLLPKVSTLQSKQAVKSYVWQSLARSAMIVAVLVLLMPLAEPLIVLIYGADFAPAAGLFRWLLGVVIFDVVTMPVLLLPLTYQRPRQMAAADALRAVTLAISAAVLVPYAGAAGAIAARFAARFAGAILVLSLLWRGARDPARRSGPRLAVEADRPA